MQNQYKMKTSVTDFNLILSQEFSSYFASPLTSIVKLYVYTVICRHKGSTRKNVMNGIDVY